MNHNERFGALRATLQHAPSPSVWEDICTMAREFGPEAFVDQVEPYAQALLQTWPDHLRLTPRKWAKNLIRGKGFPAIRLCRHLNLSRFTIRPEQLTMLLRSQKHMQELRVLTLNGIHIDSDDLRELYSNPALSQVEHLNAEFACYQMNRGSSSSNTFFNAATTQHQLTAMLPLKSLTVNTIQGVHNYLSTPESQRLEYFKLNHWIHNPHYTLAQALHGISLPDLKHIIIDLQNHSTEEHYAKMAEHVKLVMSVQATESTWIGLPAKHYSALIEENSWARTNDLIVMVNPLDRSNQERLLDLKHTLAKRNPSTRMHSIDMPSNFSWPAMSHALEALRAAHTRHTP